MNAREIEFRQWCLKEIKYSRRVDPEDALSQLSEFFQSPQYQLVFRDWDSKTVKRNQRGYKSFKEILARAVK